MTYAINLKNKTAFVTGGSRGIGAAIVATLRNAGAKVAFTYVRNDDAATEIATKTGPNTLAIKADCSDAVAAGHAIDQTIKEFGGLDILVLNAGIAKDRVSWKLPPEDFNTVVQTNLMGTFYALQAASQHLRSQQSGKIVAISSINGLRGKAGQAAYSASKGGIVALIKSAAKELGLKKINANVVAPGLILTDMTKKLPDHILDAALDETALKQLGTCQHVADTVLFLCSSMADHITGQVINVDGGQLM